MCCITTEIVKDALLTTCLGIYFRKMYHKINFMCNMSKHYNNISDDTIIVVSSSSKVAKIYKVID